MSEPVPLSQRVVWTLLILVIAGIVSAAVYKRMNAPVAGPRPGLTQVGGEFPAVPGQPTIQQGSGVPMGTDGFPIYGQLAGFSLVDQNGQKVTAEELLGRIWIANFIFTRCGGTCVQMSNAMAALNKELAAEPEVRLLSFSMDPDFDKPEILNKYAQRYGAESPRWKLLTGEKKDMYKLTRDSFMLLVTDEGGTQEEPIVHSSKFVLVDGKGQIRGYYSGLEPDSVVKISGELRRLVKVQKQ